MRAELLQRALARNMAGVRCAIGLYLPAPHLSQCLTNAKHSHLDHAEHGAICQQIEVAFEDCAWCKRQHGYDLRSSLGTGYKIKEPLIYSEAPAVQDAKHGFARAYGTCALTFRCSMTAQPESVALRRLHAAENEEREKHDFRFRCSEREAWIDSELPQLLT